MKYCSNCGKELNDDDLFCSKCGTKQILERKCINCGIKLDEDAVFCPKCGTKQESETIVEDSTSINNYPNRITKKEYKLNQGPIDLEMIQIPGTNFEMLETPVTQKLYETVTGENPSYFDGETNPVEMVNFFDAIIFCNLLSVINRKTPCYSINGDTDVRNWPFRLGDRKHFLNSIKVDFDADGYRLPVGHEWEYAARGGQCFKHAGSDKLKPVAWYTSNSDSMTHPVKEKLENGYGLFDMNGNVWEWVWGSWYGLVYGGSWKDGKDAWSFNTSKGCNSNTIHNDVGFRIVSGTFYAKGVVSYDYDIQDYEEISFEDLDNDFDDSDSYDEDSYVYEEDSYNMEDDEYEYNSDDYEDDDSDDYNADSYRNNDSYSLRPAEQKEQILSIVRKYKEQIYTGTSYLPFYSYENIPEKNKKNLLKLSRNLSYDDFVCMIDTSILGSSKEGLVFTLEGIYEHLGPFSGSYYVRYKDIKRMEIQEVKKLCIYCANGESIYFSVSYYASKLEELITKLIELTKPIDSYLSCEETGKAKGYLSSSNRKAFYAGQINGYIRCSHEYEIKLRRQAELFLKTTNKWRRERDEYEALLDEYDATIVELEEKLAETDSAEYRQRLNNVSNYRDQLAALSY